MENEVLIEKATTFAKEQLSGEGTGHDFWHIERVLHTARRIHAAEGGDWDVIALSLLLHDVGDRKVINQPEDDYSIARDFLVSAGASSALTERVMDIITRMSFSASVGKAQSEESIEFQIVQDADRLDALGAIGIARAFAYGGKKARPLYDPEASIEAVKSSEDYKNRKSSSLHHFHEKLFLLKDLMHTETARSIAAARDAYMRGYMEQFLAEWEGER